MLEVLNFGHCDLNFIWNLNFVIWDFIGQIIIGKASGTKEPGFLCL
jgi:hypothetical protein